MFEKTFKFFSRQYTTVSTFLLFIFTLCSIYFLSSASSHFFFLKKTLITEFFGGGWFSLSRMNTRGQKKLGFVKGRNNVEGRLGKGKEQSQRLFLITQSPQ